MEWPIIKWEAVLLKPMLLSALNQLDNNKVIILTREDAWVIKLYLILTFLACDMTCGDCSDATTCITCNAGYEMANGATACTKIPEPQPTKEKGSSWIWWVLGVAVVVLIVVGVVCMIMKKKGEGSKSRHSYDDDREDSRTGMHHDDRNVEM